MIAIWALFIFIFSSISATPPQKNGVLKFLKKKLFKNSHKQTKKIRLLYRYCYDDFQDKVVFCLLQHCVKYSWIYFLLISRLTHPCHFGHYYYSIHHNRPIQLEQYTSREVHASQMCTAIYRPLYRVLIEDSKDTLLISKIG